MSATLCLDTPIDGEHEIECEKIKVMGDLVWATPKDDDRERVVPLSNVTGVSGETVEQEIEVIEAPGGQFTELVTEIF